MSSHLLRLAALLAALAPFAACVAPATDSTEGENVGTEGRAIIGGTKATSYPEAVLVDLGVPMGLVIASIHEKRDELRRLFSQSAARPAPVRAFRLDLRHRRPDRAPT